MTGAAIPPLHPYSSLSQEFVKSWKEVVGTDPAVGVPIPPLYPGLTQQWNPNCPQRFSSDPQTTESLIFPATCPLSSSAYPQCAYVTKASGPQDVLEKDSATGNLIPTPFGRTCLPQNPQVHLVRKDTGTSEGTCLERLAWVLQHASGAGMTLGEGIAKIRNEQGEGGNIYCQNVDENAAVELFVPHTQSQGEIMRNFASPVKDVNNPTCTNDNPACSLCQSSDHDWAQICVPYGDNCTCVTMQYTPGGRKCTDNDATPRPPYVCGDPNSRVPLGMRGWECDGDGVCIPGSSTSYYLETLKHSCGSGDGGGMWVQDRNPDYPDGWCKCEKGWKMNPLPCRNTDDCTPTGQPPQDCAGDFPGFGSATCDAILDFQGKPDPNEVAHPRDPNNPLELGKLVANKDNQCWIPVVGDCQPNWTGEKCDSCPLGSHIVSQDPNQCVEDGYAPERYVLNMLRHPDQECEPCRGPDDPPSSGPLCNEMYNNFGYFGGLTQSATGGQGSTYFADYASCQSALQDAKNNNRSLGAGQDCSGDSQCLSQACVGGHNCKVCWPYTSDAMHGCQHDSDCPLKGLPGQSGYLSCKSNFWGTHWCSWDGASANDNGTVNSGHGGSCG